MTESMQEQMYKHKTKRIQKFEKNKLYEHYYNCLYVLY